MKDQQPEQNKTAEFKRLLRQAYNQGRRDMAAFISSKQHNAYHLITKHKEFKDWFNKKFKP